jgi:hypothetical protein
LHVNVQCIFRTGVLDYMLSVIIIFSYTISCAIGGGGGVLLHDIGFSLQFVGIGAENLEFYVEV